MLCFKKFLVAKKSMDKREREVSRFHSKILCLSVPKLFVREPFCDVFQKVSGSEKFYGLAGRSIKNFLRKLFVSQCRIIS